MDNPLLHEKIKEVEAWRRLAQPASGESLLHHIALSLYRLQGWPWVALAEVDDRQVHLLLLSEAGSPKPGFSYPLEDAPCRLLYPAGQHADFMVFSNNMRRFPNWPLLKQLPVRSYLAQRLSDTRDHRQYHLIALHNNLVEEPQLPKSLLATSARRLAAEIRQQFERRELARLRQVAQHPALAMAFVDEKLNLQWASSGLCQLLDSPLTALHGHPIEQLFNQATPANLAISRHQPLALPQVCTLADGQRERLLLQIHALQDGYLIQLQRPLVDLLPDSGETPQQLTGRLEQELARLQRKNEVAAILFVEFVGSPEAPLDEAQREQALNWGAEQMRSVIRKEDFVGRLGDQLVMLTACFDHHGEVPRIQLNAIADKLNGKLSTPSVGDPVAPQHRLRIRLVTSWDRDIDEVLDSSHATLWQPGSTLGASLPLS